MQSLTEISKANAIYSALRSTRPVTRDDLKNYVKVFCDLDIPDKSVCADHASPMDYLWHSYSTDFDNASDKPNGDAVIWANRGGGKTVIAAVATLVDSIFKPNCQTRILGGSLEQSSRMYDCLVSMLSSGFQNHLSGAILRERCGFLNGANVQVLTQSAKSVRGSHVHKLRCDEIELFDEHVFEAAKFITQTTDDIKASMEVISTMHRPYGLMQKLVTEARKNDVPIFKWCMWEVIEKCRDRSCSQCPLFSDCRGCAKDATGYLKIDDCITQMRRSSRAAFESEMLCKKPSLQNVVFDEFDVDIHVAAVEYNESLPLYRAIDFGFVNPFVCMWIQIDSDGVLSVIDEYIRSRATIDIHAQEMKRRTMCHEERVAATYCDPAGAGVNDVNGSSAVRELRQMGIKTRYRKSGILEGIELIRRSLRSGDGSSKLIISPKCVRLIEAMQCYHYPDSSIANGELPDKDGVYDHPIDALRYFYIGYTKRGKVRTRRY